MYNLLAAEVEPGQMPYPQSDPRQQQGLAKAEAYFETLLRIYYLRHSFEMADMMMTQFLTVFAMTTAHLLETIGDSNTSTHPESAFDNGISNRPLARDANIVRFALVLAEKGLQDQGRNYYFPQTAVHVVLKRIGPEDVNLVRRYVDMQEEDDRSRQNRALHMNSQYPVDNMFKDRGTKDYMDELMKQYAGITVASRSDMAGN